jgi:hypothetical protein
MHFCYQLETAPFNVPFAVADIGDKTFKTSVYLQACHFTALTSLHKPFQPSLFSVPLLL